MFNVGQNIQLEVENNTLIIRVDLTKRLGKSSSGKSTIVATTQGNVSLPGNENIKIGVNIYTKD